ncbi:MAG: PAS domain-containing protein [Celeribacter marinus]
MNIQTTASEFTRKTEDVAFAMDELFFSRTDERGVIAAGNAVFRRISGFDWDELVGAPHKVVRHSDMPKGIFHILWTRIQTGVPAGAYVKNRTKDGRYYWVYAIISPIPGGYVSVRLKPTAQVFETVVAEYAEALRAERDEGLTPAQSAQRICERLHGLGFANYEAFSASALAQEEMARDDALGRGEDGRTRCLSRLLPVIKAIEGNQKKLFQAFEAIQGIPSNMRIVASRLEPAGGPISAISQNYRLMSNEVTDHLGAFLSDGGKRSLLDSISGRIDQALFMVAASRIQREVCEAAREALVSGGERGGFEQEVDVLTSLVDGYSKTTAEVLASVFRDVAQLRRSAKDLKQLVTGLDSIRVLCRVEAGRLGANSASLTPVINQLDRFHVEIDNTLEKIMEQAEDGKDLVERAMPRAVNRTLSPKHGGAMGHPRAVGVL